MTRQSGFALDAKQRRDWAHRTFASLVKHWGPDFESLRGLFVLHFERGALEGLQAVGSLKPGQIEQRASELPVMAHEAAMTMGLAGAAAIQAVFASWHDRVPAELSVLNAEIGVRQEAQQSIERYVSAPRERRSAILALLGRWAEQLTRERPAINGQWTGKNAHWKQRATEMAKHGQAGRENFSALCAAVPRTGAGGLARSQLGVWTEGLQDLWEAWAQLSNSDTITHDTAGNWITRLPDGVQRERSRVPMPEQL